MRSLLNRWIGVVGICLAFGSPLAVLGVVTEEGSRVQTAASYGFLPRLAVNQLFFLEQFGSFANRFRRLEYENTDITTADHVQLRALWLEKEPKGKTVIFFHGNGMTCGRTIGFLQWYVDHGFNALAITIRGYPGSTGSSVHSGEKGVLLDVEAAVQFVLKRGVPRDQVVVHGLSLGGAYALKAGRYFHFPVVLDRPFTTPGAAVRHFFHSFGSLAYFDGIFNEYFKAGETIPGEGLYREFNHNVLVFDGLNNLEKAKDLKSELFVIYGSEDGVMPYEFSKDIIEARYGAGTAESLYGSHLVELKGGKHLFPPFYTSSELTEKLTAFLSAQIR